MLRIISFFVVLVSSSMFPVAFKGRCQVLALKLVLGLVKRPKEGL